VSASPFIERLEEQVSHEFGASQQYIAIAVYFDGQTLPLLAAHFYQQSLEERNHAMMLVQFLLDSELDVAIPGIAPPKTNFADAAEAVRLALAQEQRVTEQFSELTRLARDENAYQGEQFLQWFLKEQLEETSSMSDLLAIVERAGESNLLLVEEFLARNPVGDGGDDTAAPAAAGGAL
jgi:ferritin